LEFDDFNEEQTDLIEAAQLSELLEMHPKDRRKDMRYDTLLTKSVSIVDKKDRSKFTLARKRLSKKICVGLAERALKMKKSELLASLTPSASCTYESKKSKNAKKKGKKQKTHKLKKDKEKTMMRTMRRSQMKRLSRRAMRIRRQKWQTMKRLRAWMRRLSGPAMKIRMQLAQLQRMMIKVLRCVMIMKSPQVRC
jgi:hypothetical protein